MEDHNIIADLGAQWRSHVEYGEPVRFKRIGLRLFKGIRTYAEVKEQNESHQEDM